VLVDLLGEGLENLGLTVTLASVSVVARPAGGSAALPPPTRSESDESHAFVATATATAAMRRAARLM
jgi:hypothetical protein